ncbi:retinoic acid-induced protein 2 [Egretta garzetta]|uniref:retinoic acid-induced protein 2 n=1 Tax=Egretta garzetta TaxID=188379 RepID=UPI00051F1523|nr:retinoic acid-induced protein 2 [Egretta garzetta]
MEELYKDAPNLPMDVTSSPSAMANNKLENGVAQLITAEAWNINSADLMKKALSPLVTVPAPSILTPPAESQSGGALKVAATVLQPICLGDSPVVLPIHLQVAGRAAPQTPATNTAIIVSVKDAVPTIFCGKIKGLSGVSTKNFSFKRDLPQDSVLQCYDVKSPPEPRDSAEALRKPVKNRSVKLKKMNSPEIHILPIKKQRLAAFFPRK